MSISPSLPRFGFEADWAYNLRVTADPRGSISDEERRSLEFGGGGRCNIDFVHSKDWNLGRIPSICRSLTSKTPPQTDPYSKPRPLFPVVSGDIKSVSWCSSILPCLKRTLADRADCRNRSRTINGTNEVSANDLTRDEAVV